MKESERERVSEKDVGSIYFFFFFRFSMEMSKKKKRKVALVNLPNCNLPPPLYLQA